jgi:hypothetical protein
MAVIASHWYKRTTNPSILSFSLTCLASAARSRCRLLPYLYRLLHSGHAASSAMTATYTAASSTTPRRCPHPTNPQSPSSTQASPCAAGPKPSFFSLLRRAVPHLHRRIRDSALQFTTAHEAPLRSSSFRFSSPRVRWPPPPASPCFVLSVSLCFMLCLVRSGRVALSAGVWSI